MGRPAKHNWQSLYDEYNAGGYDTITSFAETKGIHPFAVQREFRKIKKQGEQNKTKPADKTKQNIGAQQNKTEPFPGQCEATGHKSGERCKRKAMHGERFCRLHLDGWPGQCTAKSKQTGERCKKKAEPGKDKCKFHGGKSTGSVGYQNALKHGFFAKIFPDDEETRAIIGEIMEKSPLDIIWEQIVIQYTAIARAQKIMFVKDRDDMTEYLKREKETSGLHSDGWEKEYELQFAWDKHASFLKAQSEAMKTLERLIQRYEDLVEKYELKGLVVEEHRLRIAKLKAEVEKIQGGGPGNGDSWADLTAEGDDDEPEES